MYSFENIRFKLILYFACHLCLRWMNLCLFCREYIATLKVALKDDFELYILLSFLFFLRSLTPNFL